MQRQVVSRDLDLALLAIVGVILHQLFPRFH
jgi:hypothetical protein